MMWHDHGIKRTGDKGKILHLHPKHQWRTFRMWRGLAVIYVTKAERFYLKIHPFESPMWCDHEESYCSPGLHSIKLCLVSWLTDWCASLIWWPKQKQIVFEHHFEKLVVLPPPNLAESYWETSVCDSVKGSTCLWITFVAAGRVRSSQVQVICLSIHVPLPSCINCRDVVVYDCLIELVLLHSSSFLVFLRRFLMVSMICRPLSSLTPISPFHTSGTCVRMRKRKQCFWAFISVPLSPLPQSFFFSRLDECGLCWQTATVRLPFLAQLLITCDSGQVPWNP